jgi:hypothetical protein
MNISREGENCPFFFFFFFFSLDIHTMNRYPISAVTNQTKAWNEGMVGIIFLHS